MCRAYCIGRVVDCAPSPGMITVNVQVRLMESDELGRRHDEANTITRTYMEGDEQKQKIYYTGRIGSECPTELIGELGGEFGELAVSQAVSPAARRRAQRRARRDVRERV